VTVRVIATVEHDEDLVADAPTWICVTAKGLLGNFRESQADLAEALDRSLWHVSALR
jgi:hypothetical protein